MFTSRNRMRFHFLSHKFSRLILPWAVLAVLAATWALLDSAFRTFLLCDDAALGLLALLDPIVPERWLPKRRTSPARTFLSMNAASAAAIAVFFVPPGRLWTTTRVEQAAHHSAEES